jgi:hypothetical protein
MDRVEILLETLMLARKLQKLPDLSGQTIENILKIYSINLNLSSKSCLDFQSNRKIHQLNQCENSGGDDSRKRKGLSEAGLLNTYLKICMMKLINRRSSFISQEKTLMRIVLINTLGLCFLLLES